MIHPRAQSPRIYFNAHADVPESTELGGTVAPTDRRGGTKAPRDVGRRGSAAAGRSHVITRPPAAVVGPGRLVDAPDISTGGYRACIQHREQHEPERSH